MTDHLRYEVDDEFIATITIDKPDRKNAIDNAMREAFFDAIAQASADDKVRVVILTGAGGVFSSGRDLADMSKVAPEQRGKTYSHQTADGLWHLSACPKPVIAAVDGAAVGWGVELTSQCDVRIVSTRARFGWLFVHRGLVTDTAAGTWVLPRIVGFAAAARLLYSGEIIDAQEALRIGYVQAVVEPDALMEAARMEARRYAKGSPFAVQRMKRLLWAGLAQDPAEHYRLNADTLAECFLSADHKEGVAAFLEKRAPTFTGR
jgi:enoyl-CoA hydratase/carnithine racemase